MAKIMDGNVTIMYDVKENVMPTYQQMVSEGANVKYVEL